MKSKKLFYTILTTAGLSLSPLTSVPILASDNSSDALTDTIAMFRFYNHQTGEHFYTGNPAEQQALLNSEWKYEGVGWFAPATSDTPVYRLLNPNRGDHHYTTSKDEKDALLSHGWIDEGIGWYSAPDTGIPVYRQYNVISPYGHHNYTISLDEQKFLYGYGWRPEGIAWYGEEGPETQLDLTGTYTSRTRSKIDESTTTLKIDSSMFVQGSFRSSSGGTARVSAWQGKLTGIVPAGENCYVAVAGQMESIEPDATPLPGEDVVIKIHNQFLNTGNSLMIYMPGYPVNKLDQLYQNALKKAGYQWEVLERPCIRNLQNIADFYILD